MFKNRKLIAILRGITPDQIVEAADIIIRSGIDWLEVTTNSPDYLESVRRMAQTHPDAMVGVGTVLTPEQVEESQTAGTKFIVSPNADPEVIKKTKALGLISVPGILTPTEGFAALQAGADILKLFPTRWVGYSAINDLRAVLPPNTLVFAVGGVSVNHYHQVLTGSQKTEGDELTKVTTKKVIKGMAFDGIGVGSDLFRSGQSLDELKTRAEKVVLHYDQAIRSLEGNL